MNKRKEVSADDMEFVLKKFERDGWLEEVAPGEPEPSELVFAMDHQEMTVDGGEDIGVDSRLFGCGASNAEAFADVQQRFDLPEGIDVDSFKYISMPDNERAQALAASLNNDRAGGGWMDYHNKRSLRLAPAQAVVLKRRIPKLQAVV